MTLLKLEAKQLKFIPYYLAALVIPLISLLFVYLLVFVGIFHPEELVKDPQMSHFSFLLQISFLINVAGFIMLGTAMVSKVILEAYTDKRVYLTFSYPVARKKIFYHKLGLCLGFCSLGVFGGIFITNSLFYVLESITHLLPREVAYSDVLGQINLMLAAVALLVSITVIALYIGWKKKSIALTMAMGVILFSLPSNMMSAGSPSLVVVAAFVLVLIAVGLTVLLRRRIEEMEV